MFSTLHGTFVLVVVQLNPVSPFSPTRPHLQQLLFVLGAHSPGHVREVTLHPAGRARPQGSGAMPGPGTAPQGPLCVRVFVCDPANGAA